MKTILHTLENRQKLAYGVLMALAVVTVIACHFLFGLDLSAFKN